MVLGGCDMGRALSVRVWFCLIIILIRLQDYADDNNSQRENLVDSRIVTNSHLQLMVVLYEISEKETIKDLIFDLDWGIPYNQTVDSLDGTCFMHTVNKCWRKYDYQSTDYSSLPCTKHSGDVLDRTNRRGDFVYMNIL